MTSVYQRLIKFLAFFLTVVNNFLQSPISSLFPQVCFDFLLSGKKIAQIIGRIQCEVLTTLPILSS